jgi:hypothetical protein
MALVQTQRYFTKRETRFVHADNSPPLYFQAFMLSQKIQTTLTLQFKELLITSAYLFQDDSQKNRRLTFFLGRFYHQLLRFGKNFDFVTLSLLIFIGT